MVILIDLLLFLFCDDPLVQNTLNVASCLKLNKLRARLVGAGVEGKASKGRGGKPKVEWVLGKRAI